MSELALDPADFVLEILEFPDPRLAVICEDAVPGQAMVDLLTRMVVTMGPRPDTHGRWLGVGIAAPQVGVNVRAIAVHDEVTGLVWAMLNPRIVERSGLHTTETEECLSCPGVSVPVRRAYSVRVEGVTALGEPMSTGVVKGLTARTFQHEIDHLNGRVIATHTPPRRRQHLRLHG